MFVRRPVRGLRSAWILRHRSTAFIQKCSVLWSSMHQARLSKCWSVMWK